MYLTQDDATSDPADWDPLFADDELLGADQVDAQAQAQVVAQQQRQQQVDLQLQMQAQAQAASSGASGATAALLAGLNARAAAAQHALLTSPGSSNVAAAAAGHLAPYRTPARSSAGASVMMAFSETDDGEEDELEDDDMASGDCAFPTLAGGLGAGGSGRAMGLGGGGGVGGPDEELAMTLEPTWSFRDHPGSAPQHALAHYGGAAMLGSGGNGVSIGGSSGGSSRTFGTLPSTSAGADLPGPSSGWGGLVHEQQVQQPQLTGWTFGTPQGLSKQLPPPSPRRPPLQQAHMAAIQQQLLLQQQQQSQQQQQQQHTLPLDGRGTL